MDQQYKAPQDTPDYSLPELSVAIQEIASLVANTLSIEEVYTQFAREVNRLIPFDRIALGLVDFESGVVRSVHQRGVIYPERAPTNSFELAGSAVEAMLQAGRTLIRPDIAADLRYPADNARLHAGLRSGIYAPLRAKGKIIGALGLHSRQPEAFGLREQWIVERLADQIAPAVENARLFAQTLRDKELLAHNVALLSSVLENVGRL